MEKYKEKLVEYIFLKSDDKNIDYKILEYGLQTGAELLVCVMANLLIAIYLNAVKEYVFLLFVFAELRSYGGGIHLKKFSSCFLCSSLVISGILFVSKTFVLPNTIALMVLLGSITYILVIGPVGNANRQLDNIEMEYFQKKLIIRGVCIVGISIFLKLINQDRYFIIAVLVVFIMAISMFAGRVTNCEQ